MRWPWGVEEGGAAAARARASGGVFLYRTQNLFSLIFVLIFFIKFRSGSFLFFFFFVTGGSDLSGSPSLRFFWFLVFLISRQHSGTCSVDKVETAGDGTGLVY